MHTGLSSRQRISILIALLAASMTVLLLVDPIPQDPDYHRFADSRVWFGIPNFSDVMSNAGFALVGMLGIWLVVGKRRGEIFPDPRDSRAYLVLFIGVGLVSLGSAYYHLDPSNERLFWDRLPMSVAFMAFCSAIVADRIDAKAGNSWLLLILVGLGMTSLFYWMWTESMGRGDLRFYGLVQFFPLIALPVVCWLFPEHRYTATRYLVWVVAWYGLSKVLEYFDQGIFHLTGQTISGHSLKHLAAAIATLVIFQMLRAQRSPVASS